MRARSSGSKPRAKTPSTPHWRCSSASVSSPESATRNPQSAGRNPQSAVRNETVRLTPLGDQVRRLPLHPRLARMLVAAGGAREMAYAAALLSERHVLPPRRASTTSDLLSVLDEWHSVPAHVQRVARDIESLCRPTAFAPPALRRVALQETEFRKAVLAGYPDRV